jgi:excisionase family DNA binding protein
MNSPSTTSAATTGARTPTRAASRQPDVAPDSAFRIILPPEPVSYRPRTAAETVHVSRPLIANEIKAGRLAAIRLGGVVLISRAALQAWLDDHSNPWGRR